MIKARIAFDLHFPINSPLHKPYSPICRTRLRFPSLHPFPRQFRKIADFNEISFNSSAYKDDLSHNNVTPSGGEPVHSGTWLGVATLISKITGLSECVGPVATAFKYAWVLPGFTSTLLGGVNGPIHIIMATTLSKLPNKRGKKLFQHMTTIMFLIGGVVGTIVYIFPEFIIHIYAPGLWILEEGQTIRKLAMEPVIQSPLNYTNVSKLKIMIPCIVLAGPVGLGFGHMSAEGNNALPSLSPALSSSILIVSDIQIVPLRMVRLTNIIPNSTEASFQPIKDLLPRLLFYQTECFHYWWKHYISCSFTWTIPAVDRPGHSA